MRVESNWLCTCTMPQDKLKTLAPLFHPLSSETQGKLDGGQEKSKQMRKNLGKEKSRTLFFAQFFFLSVLTFPAPTNCPWVSGDEVNAKPITTCLYMFSKFAAETCNYFVFWLVHWIACAWLEGALWLSFNGTQLKTNLDYILKLNKTYRSCSPELQQHKWNLLIGQTSTNLLKQI